MTTTSQPARGGAGRRTAAGWWTCIAMGAFLVANGVWLASSLASPSVFEGDTGVPLSEVQAAYPSVVERLEGQAVELGLSVTGIGLMLAVMAAVGLRTGEWSAWIGSATGTLAVAAIAIAVFTGGSAAIGSVWATYAVVLAVGLFLARPGARRA